MLTFNRQNKGSILIWTVMLGAILSSVFFFLAMRLRENIKTQNELIENQSGKAYLESYADYLTANMPIDGPITFGDITGSLSSTTSSIEGVLDSGAALTLAPANTLCWGKNAEPNDLLKNNTPAISTGTCPGYSYKIEGSGTIQAITPVHYKIEGGFNDGTKKYLNLDLDLSYGKKINIFRILPVP